MCHIACEQGGLRCSVERQVGNPTLLGDLNTELRRVYVLGLSAPPTTAPSLNQTLQLDYTWDSTHKV